jgi:heme/copper-type cytochrome/quinol oxidase subunit 2
MKKTFFFFVLSSLFLGVLFFSLPALADDQTSAAPNPLSISNPQMSAFLPASGIGVTSVAGITSAIITTVLGLLGIIFVVLLIFAGFQWMTAEGNEEKVEKSKATITRAIIGLAIIIAAYAITYFVFNALNTAAGSGGGTPVNQSQSTP